MQYTSTDLQIVNRVETVFSTHQIMSTKALLKINKGGYFSLSSLACKVLKLESGDRISFAFKMPEGLIFIYKSDHADAFRVYSKSKKKLLYFKSNDLNQRFKKCFSSMPYPVYFAVSQMIEFMDDITLYPLKRYEI
jgi:hypothetical protein